LIGKGYIFRICSKSMDLFASMVKLIPGGYEWIFIILIIVVIIFGAKKIPELARSLGKATSEFEKARVLSKKEIDKLHNADKVTREKLESIADTLRIDYIGKDDESLKRDIDAAIKRDKEYDI
jgi:sec-independent protein translocase protein TatA